MELKIQLLYLPEKVRSMEWNTFTKEYNGDIGNMIKKVKLQHHTLNESSVLSARPDGYDAPHTVVSKASGSVAKIRKLISEWK